MAFCSFSKDCDDNSYTLVENKFITKYLPEAEGFAVKVYLYGLYLCEHGGSEFSLASMAEVLKSTEDKIKEAFMFWEDYDLVQIIAKEPFTVQYLPVRSAVGRPKKVRYEQYADFNKELQRKMQKVGKFVSPNDYVKYMRFLEEHTLQPQALLLIAEYCINKHGESVAPLHIFNKAKKLISNGISTYEQVEKELSNYKKYENDLIAVFNAMSIYLRTPNESDYVLYNKWVETLGFKKNAVIMAASKLKRGTMNSLDLTLDELSEKGKLTAKEVDEYLTKREAFAKLTFRLGRKLGVKVQNPAPYIDEYVEKWCNYGFDENSLLDLAFFCLKTERSSFEDMSELVQKLFNEGVVTPDSVKEFLKGKNGELKLFAKIQDICGNIRKNATNLSLISTWKEWNFNDEMILEAAKRSATSANPIAYMNKILSDWKRQEVYEVKNIPDAPTVEKAAKGGYVNPVIEAVNAKTDRERYYALLREKAQAKAEKYLKKANGNNRFKEITAALSKMELALAKAEVFEPKNLPKLMEEKSSLLHERKVILAGIGIDEAQLIPQFCCEKCSDTGFLPSGVACNCYTPQ